MKSQSLCEDSDLFYFFHIPSKNSSKDDIRVSVVHAIICESDPARLEGGGDSPALNKKVLCECCVIGHEHLITLLCSYVGE
jgi:threonine dehydrogenase-like Zn-dependent dehydrogenase